jgi:acyl-CoA synthetase (AMP-forming)/AMP-acid ligase II
MFSKKFSSLIEMLEYQADHNGDKIAFTFQTMPCTYDQMWESINCFGAYLKDLGVSQGDRVVLALPNSVEFFGAFYGIQRVGGIAVPLFPGSGPERLLSIANLCEARLIVVPSSLPEKQLIAYRDTQNEIGVRLITASESLGVDPHADFPKIKPQEIAFIQYTSGSTGNPKGVQLSHDNLLTNMVQMIMGMEITEEDIFVSWLPVYHDMGLILMTMVPFYLGIVTHLLHTNLHDVHPWLDAIQTQKATFTASPDFAYRLCLRHTDPDEYDLSSLRVALNAAESVRIGTISEFEAAFNLDGVMLAGYGLAEATVGVSMWPPGSTPRFDERGFVSVGAPFPEVEVRITDNGATLSPGEIGEITIRSPANSIGYLNNTEETRNVFTKDGFMRSGDLGYLDLDDNLYIVGRKKNIIKRSGETISPREIEEIVDAIPAIRYSATIGIDRGGIEGEQVYIFAEVRDGDSQPEIELHNIAIDIVEEIHDRMGYRPGRVYLVKPHAIPLTHNGKIQHTRLKNQYLDGDLNNAGNILYPNY